MMKNQRLTGLTDEIVNFVGSVNWIFAKTYAETWPHEYIVREKVDPVLFELLVRHIREHGVDGAFYELTIRYFEEDGMVYWTMGAPISETTVINRCKKNGTYESRRRAGTLPKDIR